MRPILLALGALFCLVTHASAASATTPIVDQEPAPVQFQVFLRVDFFAPLGQSFVPQLRRHVGVNLFLRNLLLFGGQPPAIFTATLRSGSVTGPILATGSTPPLPLFDPQWLEVLFDEPVSLVPGDTYFLEVSTANVSGFWGRAGFDPYPVGVGFEQGVPTPHFDFGFQTLVLSVQEIGIDIKPGSAHNPVSPAGRGNFPVAILGSDTFDVADVDVTTLAFGPGAAAPSHDLSRPSVIEDHFRDVNDDGLTDLVFHFRIRETGIAFGDTEACLTGDTFDGIQFEGCDIIRTR